LRIEEAVASTGYTINQAARSLRLRTAKTILIALPNIGNPFYSAILDAVVNEASSRGYGVLVANRLGDDPTSWLRDYFLSHRADGLLLFDASLDAASLYGLPLNHGRLPLVVVCDELLDARFNVVTIDNAGASREAVDYLIGLGHRRIGHIRGPVVRHYPNERFNGFRAALNAAGLPVRPEWILPGDHSTRGGVAAARQFLALTDRPTAMFCANDETAIGFISEIRADGLECPRDVSVIGFDDIGVAQHLLPPLTTVRQPREELGRASTAALIDILEGAKQSRGPLHRVLKSELIVRGSTAPHVELGQRPVRRRQPVGT
jgi:LacI family repressor for deo operon, udp, cdd, tsx, nupC, and nupG